MFYSDDANGRGQPDDLEVVGTVHYDSQQGCWVGTFDPESFRHASDREK